MGLPTIRRQAQANRFAQQLDVNGTQLYAAAVAVWSNLNPDRTTFDRALSIAGVALRAAADALDGGE